MSATTSAVFITVPKYVAISANSLPKLRPAPAATTTISLLTPADSGDSNDSFVQQSKGKKRRLDHLTWEEKIQRKKLKNRVAAQTSRDRKKARMEEMEVDIKNLSAQTQILQNKCDTLQAMNDSLMEKNQKLDKEVGMLRKQLKTLQQQQQQQQTQSNGAAQTVATCSGCESIFNGSAVSNCTDPLPQGSTQMDLQSTQVQLKKTRNLEALWRIVALCLLYKICSSSTMRNSMPANWKNLPKPCLPISQQIWKQMIERAMKLMPKLQAKQSDCLDQWWGPQQSAWNPANIATATAQMTKA